MCKPTLNTDLLLVMTTEAELWVLNPGTVQVDAGPGELCGFNLGIIAPKPKGAQRDIF